MSDRRLGTSWRCACRWPVCACCSRAAVIMGRRGSNARRRWAGGVVFLAICCSGSRSACWRRCWYVRCGRPRARTLCNIALRRCIHFCRRLSLLLVWCERCSRWCLLPGCRDDRSQIEMSRSSSAGTRLKRDLRNSATASPPDMMNDRLRLIYWRYATFPARRAH